MPETNPYTSEAYRWWNDALKNGTGKEGTEIHADRPQCGCYRLKFTLPQTPHKTMWLPVRYCFQSEFTPDAELEDDDKLICIVGFSPEAPDIEPKHMARQRPPEGIWTWAAHRPVTWEAYHQAYTTGKWPDDAPGENFRPEDDVSGLVDQLTAMLENTANIGEIDSQLKCDQAANLKSRLMDVCKALDKKRIEEKRPHDEAAKKVQAKFSPWIGKAEDAIEELRRAIAPWLKKAHGAAMAAAAEAGGNAAASALDIRPKAGGLSGRRTGLRKEKVVEIVDYEAALAAVKDSEEVRAAVEKVIKRLAKAGAENIPGVKITEEMKAT